MNCAEFRDRAFDSDAGTAAHEASCAKCAALRADLAAEGKLLARGPRAPENLWLRIEGAIARRRRAWPAWVAAAAAGVLVAVGLLLFAGTPPKRKPAGGLNLVVVETPPESARAFSGIVPSYDDVNPNDALMSTITGEERR